VAKVEHQHAAAPRQNRRAFSETCAVLLAGAGRESSETTLVRSDAPADLGVAGPGGLTCGELNEEHLGEKRASERTEGSDSPCLSRIEWRSRLTGKSSLRCLGNLLQKRVQVYQPQTNRHAAGRRQCRNGSQGRFPETARFFGGRSGSRRGMASLSTVVTASSAVTHVARSRPSPVFLGAPARVSPASAAEHEQHEENDQ
jgi:hypothetical protein